MIDLGPARLDPATQALTVGARTVALQRKPYLVLLYLIENRHRMISRKELLDRFWEGQEVYDQSLSKAVGSIRKALGDSEGDLIETRWGLGYRYIGPFSEAPAAGSVAPASGGESETRSVSHDSSAVASANSAPSAADQPGSVSSARIRTRWMLAAAVIVSVAALLAVTDFALRRHGAAPAGAAAQLPVRSVAVLPFTGSAGQDDQYLGLELADSVAERLMTVPQLNVRPSATVHSVIGIDADPAVAAKKLSVETIVSGEVQRQKDRVAISVRLIDSGTGAVLWSRAFNADNSTLFATEDSIARQVSGALLPQTGLNAIKQLPAQTIANPEAFADYTKARFFATTRTRGSLARAIELLHEAIRIDPNYAPAYAALADYYQLQGFYDFVPPSDAYPRGKAAALKALSLDNSLGEAHTSLLSIHTDYDWDWTGAEREFKATVAIDPNNAVAYQYYGYALFGMGRGEEGLSVMQQAAQLDPVSPSVLTSLAWAYYLLRQNQHAVDQCDRVLELYPDFVPAHQLLGIVYGQMHEGQRAITALNKAETLEPDGVITPVLLDLELAKTGKRAEATRSLEAVLAKPDSASVPDYYIAAAWTAIGDKQKAQESLDRAVRSRSNWVIYLHYDPRFDDLRSDPRFQTLLRRVDSDSAAPTAVRSHAM
jgi:TolB-like protein/DNA-binding winged helix-turn-helix (wHTH) protein/Tfp pilus assembly protein PilF